MRSLLTLAAARIRGSDARAEAQLLLAHVLDRERAWLIAWPEFKPTAQQRNAYALLVDARCDGVPIAYLLGRREFWSLELAVGPAVLIPRPETELLVELALQRLPLNHPSSVADLGTGSGAIGLAIARERPLARVLATDASADALAIARANAMRLGIDNVQFAQGDWCSALGNACLDLIVSNPPYIAFDDPHLGEGDLRHEPMSALASGSDGLDAIRAIIGDAPTHLVAGGWLVLEHGWDQAARVRELLAAREFEDPCSVRDGGHHERAAVARWNPA